MIRFLSVTLLVGQIVCRLTAADLPALAAGSRQMAESALERARTVIAEERRTLLEQVQAAHRGAETARQRALQATQHRKDRDTELAQRRKEQKNEQTSVRSLADRAIAAARIPAEQSRKLATAPPGEGAAAALAAVDARIAALPAQLGARLAPEPVITREGQLLDVPVLRLGLARALALGEVDSTRGILTLAGDGIHWRIIGPPLPPLPAATRGQLPTALLLDPDGTAAARPTVAHRTLAQWVKAGRAWIWPIIFAFAVGLAVSVWRSIAMFLSRIDPRRLLQVADLMHRHQTEQARALVAGRATSLDRVLATGIEASTRPREVREAALEQALIAETPALQRGLGVIVVLASIAPLLGLLGTVTGMIDMFGVIAQQGSGNAKSLSGAISEALICTQAGMITAIPLLLIHAALSRLADRRLLLLEEAACGLLGLAEHGEPRQEPRLPGNRT